MTTQNNLESAAEEPIRIDAEQVAEYLRRHPDFFEQYASLLAQLSLPHDSGTAISLIERQVTVLREQNQQYKQKLMELVQIGRDNDALHQNLHRLTVALMHARTLKDALTTLFDDLYGAFNADVVSLLVRGLPEGFTDTRVRLMRDNEPALNIFERVIGQGQFVCGHLKPEQLDYLFSDRATQVASAALIPLGEAPATGILAIGNEDPNYYHPGMDTHFLRNLSDLVSCALSPYLSQEPHPA